MIFHSKASINCRFGQDFPFGLHYPQQEFELKARCLECKVLLTRLRDPSKVRPLMDELLDDEEEQHALGPC